MTSFQFAIIASGFDPASSYEDALFEAGCDDATISLQKGLLIAEFDREAESFASAVSSACQNMGNAGLKIARVEPDDLVTLSEIAERVGLSRQAIFLYAKGERLSGFPAPTAKVTARHPLWSWHAVAGWLFNNRLVGRAAVIHAHIIKEANRAIADSELPLDTLVARLADCEANAQA